MPRREAPVPRYAAQASRGNADGGVRVAGPASDPSAGGACATGTISHPRLLRCGRIECPVMHILYVAMRHEYGDPSRGLSFEEMNFRSALEGMGHELTTFDFTGRAKRDGVARMRRDLIALAAETKPDLAFFILFRDQFDTQT